MFAYLDVCFPFSALPHTSVVPPPFLWSSFWFSVMGFGFELTVLRSCSQASCWLRWILYGDGVTRQQYAAVGARRWVLSEDALARRRRSLQYFFLQKGGVN